MKASKYLVRVELANPGDGTTNATVTPIGVGQTWVKPEFQARLDSRISNSFQRALAESEWKWIFFGGIRPHHSDSIAGIIGNLRQMEYRIRNNSLELPEAWKSPQYPPGTLLRPYLECLELETRIYNPLVRYVAHPPPLSTLGAIDSRKLGWMLLKMPHCDVLSSQRPFPFAAKCVNKVVPMVPEKFTSGYFVNIDNIPGECEAVAHLAALSIPTLRMFVEHLEQQFKATGVAQKQCTVPSTFYVLGLLYDAVGTYSIGNGQDTNASNF
ncbi:uncharacterized protein STEHIDRAFT_111779 [Stereum hirsutum FP-91666 SS1]|uniref:uncharacterized protein n=1 Tax=Stereum hirsutum (strain FP-91666) TaxID=721885 RepID=UPI000444A631|nr:uncharacterized protein STEHIDRAFT_111779 [Stereum hirsutum FP-91666 SS1]EIM86287.1 hypothetical protein STEHIDRAFT_111779 [Stereum hirsutum FP-91666 SS1]